MEPIEQLLKTVKKPAVEVPEFKQNLRQALTRGPVAAQRSLFLGIPALATSVAVLACILVAFIAMPQWPLALHNMLSGRQAYALVANVPQSEQPQYPEGHLDSLHAAQQEGDWLPYETDEVALQNWLEANQMDGNMSYTSLDEGQPYIVRRFQLENGQRVTVWSKLDHPEAHKNKANRIF